MAQFVVNSQRLDPYKNFKFRVFWDDKEIPAVTYVSTAEEAASGELNIERKLTRDASVQDWLDDVIRRSAILGGFDDISSLCKDVKVEQIDEDGEVVVSWTAIRCRPTAHERHPALTGQPYNDDSRERMTLIHDGIQS
ncbi:MAG TPA: phage tail protein [Acidobacteriaceae bacterium]|jgi:hypothetical protein